MVLEAPPTRWLGFHLLPPSLTPLLPPFLLRPTFLPTPRIPLLLEEEEGEKEEEGEVKEVECE